MADNKGLEMAEKVYNKIYDECAARGTTPFAELRAKTGLSQQKFADAYGFSKRSIQNYESLDLANSKKMQLGMYFALAFKVNADVESDLGFGFDFDNWFGGDDEEWVD